jgi:hypothetical protein
VVRVVRGPAEHQPLGERQRAQRPPPRRRRHLRHHARVPQLCQRTHHVAGVAALRQLCGWGGDARSPTQAASEAGSLASVGVGCPSTLTLSPSRIPTLSSTIARHSLVLARSSLSTSTAAAQRDMWSCTYVAAVPSG